MAKLETTNVNGDLNVAGNLEVAGKLSINTVVLNGWQIQLDSNNSLTFIYGDVAVMQLTSVGKLKVLNLDFVDSI